MSLTELKNLGRLLTSFLALFADCFESLAGRRLLQGYVKGQLSDVQRKYRVWHASDLLAKFATC